MGEFDGEIELAQSFGALQAQRAYDSAYLAPKTTQAAPEPTQTALHVTEE